MQRPQTNFSKSLSEISLLIGLDVPSEFESVKVLGISQSSHEVEKGDLFVALPGAKVHGAHFVADAIAKGAVAVLTDYHGAKLITGLPVLTAVNPRRAAGIISAWFYQEPMRDLYTVGITGTNGKTTVTTLLHQVMQLSGRECGLIGTVEVRIGRDVYKSLRTTPESSDLQAISAVMRERHLQSLIMEVSSHAITLERISGSHFAIVGFTNLSQDHLDFHSTMEEYFLAKEKLFNFEYADLAVINIDDAYGARLAATTQLPVLSLSRRNSNASWYFESIVTDETGASIAIRGKGGVLIESKTSLQGGFNFDNLLMAVAIAVESGVDLLELAAIVPKLTGALGRLEAVRLGQSFAAFVDYAHSPDAVSRVLETARQISQGRVIAVLGCGGDRDKSKRALMGKALRDGADIAIYTSDNPRNEKPEEILAQMVQGIEVQAPSEVISDRSLAIKTAVNLAKSGDIVLVLGKGHESGQEVSGIILPFEDRMELARAIEGKT